MKLAIVGFVVLLAACGGGAPNGDSVSLEDALGAEGKTVIVEGSIVAIEGEPVRLCYALLESYPPQCGQPALELRGLDLDVLELVTSRGDPSLPVTRWSDRPVRIRGTVEDGVLVVGSVLS